jgi:outer membrane protein assembly factor BamB
VGNAYAKTIGAEPHDVAVHAGRAFVGSRADGTVTVVDPATVEATHDLAADARILGVEAAAEDVYVSHYDDAAVSAVDLAAGRVAWTAATPARPFEPVAV